MTDKEFNEMLKKRSKEEEEERARKAKAKARRYVPYITNEKGFFIAQPALCTIQLEIFLQNRMWKSQ